jgi:hypothetical protein
MLQKNKWQDLAKLGAIVLTVALLVGCGSPAKSEAEIAAEQTLSAIYAEGTAQALAVQQPVVEEPAEVMVEPAAKEPQQEDWLTPGEPPEPERTLKDSISSYFAPERKATQGDNFLNGLYERPFTSEVMDYRPDLDITEVDFAPGEGFFFFTIRLFGMNLQGGGLKGTYGIEFDRTLTGRGDMLIYVFDPQKEWSKNEVVVYLDDNRDVGGLKPVIAEAGFDGSGYDVVFEMDADKNAYARIDPKDGNAVQIAVSYGLVETPEEFLWGAWADDGLVDPAQFDYNDRMGPSAAGSPILGADYPIKDLYNLDNTCRLPYGFEQTGLVVGMCKIGVPIVESKCRPTCLQWVYFGATKACLQWDTICD